MASTKPIPSYPPIAVQLRARARRRFVLRAAMGIVLLLVLLDHAGCFGYRGDDAALFDRRGVRIVSVIEADALTIRTTDTGRETVVQLLGADAPRGAAGAEARNYTASRLTGKTLTLRLDPLQRRDAAGRLPAYLYLTDIDPFNLDLVREGFAYADRRVHHSLRPLLEGAENDARKHARGLWRGLRESEMPAWRQQWLKELRERHRSAE